MPDLGEGCFPDLETVVSLSVVFSVISPVCCGFFAARALHLQRRDLGDAACKDHLSRPVRFHAANMVGSWGSASFLGLWSKT